MCTEKAEKTVALFKKNKIHDITHTRDYAWDDNILKKCFQVILENGKNPVNGWYKRIAEFAKYKVPPVTWHDRVKEILTFKPGISLYRLQVIYGEEEADIRWKSYCEKQAYSNSFEYKSKKHGWTEEKFKEFNKSRAVTKEALMSKYGDEIGMKKWDDYVARQRYTTTKEYFIETYGAIAGEQKWKNFDEKRAIISGKQTSMVESELFESLGVEYTPQFEMKYDVSDGRKRYTYDAFILGTNKLIEFNGDFWHMNPALVGPNDINKVSSRVASDIWAYDEAKIKYAESVGYEVKVIWESDYYKNKDILIQDIKKWIIG